MNYLILCACAFSTLSYSVEGVPVVIPEEAQVLSELASHATKYISGQNLLSQKQLDALNHLMKESIDSGVELSQITEGAQPLLQIIEVTSDRNDAICKEDLEKVRRLELKKSGWVEGSDPKKYVELAKGQGNLNGFSISERASFLRRSEFTSDDLNALRLVEMKSCGLFDREIEVLRALAKKNDSDFLVSEEETASLKKWIQVESLQTGRDLMSFEEMLSLHELIQNQPSPPFSPKELKFDQLAFQRQLESAPLASSEILNTLKHTAGNVSAYLGENETLTALQVKACQCFVEAVLQFGRVPGLDQAEVGRLLQLMELRPEFQQLMYPLKNVFAIELAQSGFLARQKKALDVLRERVLYNETATLSKSEVLLLKEYIVKAKKSGGLNGLGMQERTALFATVQKHLDKSSFTPSDLEVLRAREQRMNGFSAEEVYQVKLLSKKDKEQLSAEQKLLLKRFNQIQRVVGVTFF